MLKQAVQWDITRVSEMARDNKLCEWSSELRFLYTNKK